LCYPQKSLAPQFPNEGKLLTFINDRFNEIMQTVSFYNVVSNLDFLPNEQQMTTLISSKATPVEYDVRKVQTYRPFVQDIVKKSFLFKTMKVEVVYCRFTSFNDYSLQPEQIESIVALIKQVVPKFR